jgi:hypothetical protein
VRSGSLKEGSGRGKVGAGSIFRGEVSDESGGKQGGIGRGELGSLFSLVKGDTKSLCHRRLIVGAFKGY